MDQIINATQAGKILGITRHQAAHLVRQGKLLATRRKNAGVTSGYKFKLSDVYALKAVRDAPILEQRCGRCKEVKPLNAFPQCRTRKSGRHCYCYKCRKKLYQATRKQSRAYRKKRQRTHGDEIRAQARASYHRNRIEISRRSRKKRAEQGSQLNAKQRERYQNDPAFRARCRSHTSRRRALIASSSDDVGFVSHQDIIERDNATCWICGLGPLAYEDIHIDHVIPLSKGGSHTSDNLRVACAQCNLRKADKLPSEISHLRYPLGC